MIPNLRNRFTAFVVFQGSDNRRFWRIFTRRGWRHVFVIIPAYYPEPSLNADVYSIFIEFCPDHIRHDIVFQHPRKLCRKMLADRSVTAIIELPIDQKFTGRYVARGFMTCVSFVKACLGINVWQIMTPQHLARWMLSHGGKLMELEE